ncbi:DUF4148 domain-containing protein [Trinickia sp. EG282A]|uniref:DUF4148 domain-containing protein n=1 Tax=Trinickia sp. EG282A TaxID=3237013 RepID=UPI0034D21F95
MSKILAGLIVAVAAVAAPTLSFAQSNGQVTRAQVRAELIQVEQAGYNPGLADDPNYPADIQAAEAKVAAQRSNQSARQDAPQPATQDVGGTGQSSAASSGARVRIAVHTACVGPATFCDPYFGK